MTAYRPSPRPTFAGPALIPYAGVTRHIWGDAEAGEVADWIYASTERVHALVFGLAPGAWFRHSPEFRTIFRADVYLLEGVLHVRTFSDDGISVFELHADDAAYIPHGVAHEYRSYGASQVRAVFGVAPSYLP